jgi:hypothetical protein
MAKKDKIIRITIKHPYNISEDMGNITHVFVFPKLMKKERKMSISQFMDKKIKELSNG